MKCNFSNNKSINNGKVKIENQEITNSEHFCYLGSIISKDGEIGDDVVYRIKIDWLKWRIVLDILCDWQIPQ